MEASSVPATGAEAAVPGSACSPREAWDLGGGSPAFRNPKPNPRNLPRGPVSLTQESLLPGHCFQTPSRHKRNLPVPK